MNVEPAFVRWGSAKASLSGFNPILRHRLKPSQQNLLLAELPKMFEAEPSTSVLKTRADNPAALQGGDLGLGGFRGRVAEHHWPGRMC